MPYASLRDFITRLEQAGRLVRVTAPDMPVPFAPPLEKAFLPQVEDVVAAIDRLSAY